MIPVVVLLIYVVATPLGVTIPYGGTIAIGAFFLFAVGIGLFGVGSYRTPELSNTFAVALLAISATYFIVLGDGLWNGFPNSQSVLFATVVVQTGALFAIGYLLYTE